MDHLLAETGKIFSTQNPDGSWTFVGNWFTYANLTLATGLFGFTFLIACILTAAYYVLIVVTDPTQTHERKRIAYNVPTALKDWNFERVLHLIYISYTTYTTLDLEDVTCQSRIICELQESEGRVGKYARNIFKLLSFSFLNNIPYIREYRAAAQHGQRRHDNGTDDDGNLCDVMFSPCKFSVKRFNQQFNSVFGDGIPVLGR